jgi:hypothetical protein
MPSQRRSRRPFRSRSALGRPQEIPLAVLCCLAAEDGTFASGVVLSGLVVMIVVTSAPPPGTGTSWRRGPSAQSPGWLQLGPGCLTAGAGGGRKGFEVADHDGLLVRVPLGVVGVGAVQGVEGQRFALGVDLAGEVNQGETGANDEPVDVWPVGFGPL